MQHNIFKKLFNSNANLHFKKVITYYILIILVSVTSTCTIFFISDPLRLFHSPLVHKKRLFDNMRQQAAGIINTFEYDSIILGTSMLENTSALEASQALSGNFINISIAGGDFYERSVILDHALRKRCIKNVIYSLDTYYLSPRFGHPRFPHKNWGFLYDESDINDIQIYFSKHFFDKALFFKKIGKETDFDRPRAWKDIPAHAARFGGLQNWLKTPDHGATKELIDLVEKATSSYVPQQTHVPDEAWEATQNYLEKYILTPVANNPDVNFFFVFPPYHTLSYYQLALHPFNFALHIKTVAYITKKLSAFQNAKVYAFNHLSFTDDIANYKDLRHYSSEVNSLMLQYMKRNIGLLTPGNIDEYIKRATDKVYSFPFATLQKEIGQYHSQP